MSKQLKKLLSLTVLICMVTVTLSSARIYGSEITPRYNNVSHATMNTTVNNSGTMTINYYYSGISGTTSKAVITTYIEKQFLFIFWTRVDIGTPNNEWTQTINDYKYTGTRTFKLPSTGTYRTTVIYEISGSGGATDTITCQDEITY